MLAFHGQHAFALGTVMANWPTGPTGSHRRSYLGPISPKFTQIFLGFRRTRPQMPNPSKVILGPIEEARATGVARYHFHPPP